MNYGVYPPGGYPPPPSNGPMPPQGVYQNVPQGMPPQGAQNVPQGMPPQGAYQNNSGSVPECSPGHAASGSVPECPPGHAASGSVSECSPGRTASGSVPECPPGHAASGSVPKRPSGSRLRERTRMPPGPASGSVPKRPSSRGAYHTASRGISEFPPGNVSDCAQGVPQNVGSPYGGVFPAGYGALPVYPPPFAMGGKPPRDPRQQGASRAVNRMCLLALAQVALSFVWQIPLQMLLAAVGVNILTNGLGYQWLAGVLAPLSTALPFVAYLIFRREDPSDYLKFEKTGFSGGVLCVLGGLAIVLLGNYPAAFISDFFSAFGYQSAASLIFGRNLWRRFCWKSASPPCWCRLWKSWCSAALCFPLCENTALAFPLWPPR